ncbi:MAG: type II secretion system secretin GspD [Pseudomonadota bacterium]
MRGTDDFVAPAGPGLARGPLAAVGRDGSISVSLIDASIEEAARAILGNALGLTYSVRPGLSGRVTLQTAEPLSRAALLEAFQTALEFNGATLIESADLVVVAQIAEASPRFVAVGDDRGVGRRIVVAPLRFIAAAEMVRLLEPIVSRGAILRTSTARNLLMITGSSTEIDAALEAIRLFDVDVLAGKSVALFKLDAADPNDIAAELELIFGSAEGGSLRGVIDFIPNERLGSVLVVTSRARYLEEARRWVRELDATAGRTRRYSRAYRLQNRAADEVQAVLEALIAPQTELSEEADAAAIETVIDDRDERPRIVADPGRNTIIVYGTEVEHAEVERLVRSLDTSPPQVLLEATIAEVRLSDGLEFGVRWFLENDNQSFAFSDVGTGAVAPSFPGFSFLFSSGGARVALNALASVTDVNVVSSPSLLVLDNREAELRVGDQVPVATQTAVATVDPSAPIVNAIELRDTGIILRVRPRVSDQGRVIMEIEQEVSDVAATTTSGIDSPTISQRVIRTSVAVDSGETLALGGLIQDSTNRTDAKVPLLGDIPILGAAFRNRSDTVARTELLVLITPRVVRDAMEARRVTDEFRRRLSAPDGLLEGAERRRPQPTIERLLE